jgi:hypothetical protein
MKRLLAVAFTLLLFVPSAALADGGMFMDYRAHMYEPEQKAIITWDGSTETLFLSTRFTSDRLGNMAWVVPLPSSSKPDVDASDLEIFQRFVSYFSPPRRYYGFGVGALNAEKVSVIETKKVDIYDVAILKSDSASALVDWLNGNGYYVPSEASSLIGKYVGPDHYFVANKVNLRNKYSDMIGDLVGLNSSFENLTIDDQLSIIESYSHSHSTDARVQAFYRDFWALTEGMATPLKITFAPPGPFFPLQISGVNDGQTDIEVYVAAPYAVQDSGGTLKLDKALTITDSFRSDLSGDLDLSDSTVVTRLTYVGSLKDLGADATFARCDGCAVENVELRALTAKVNELAYTLPMAIFAFVVFVFMLAAVLVFGALGILAVKRKILRLDWRLAALAGGAFGEIISEIIMGAVLLSTSELRTALLVHFVLLAAFLWFLAKRMDRYFALILAYFCATFLAFLIFLLILPPPMYVGL